MKTDPKGGLFSDWRILLLIALIIFSVASIYLPPNPERGITGNLQLGLDLEGGAWLQLSFKSVVVGFETDLPTADFVSALKEKIDAEIYLVGENRLEIRKLVPREELEAIVAEAGGRIVSYTEGVSPETGDDIKRILEEKINTLGTRDAKVNTLTSLNDVTRYIRIELAGVDIATARQIVGKQGKFEIRVQASGNETAHVLFGDAITGVQTPQQYPPGSNSWGVGFTLSAEGAEAFRDAAIKYGAVDAPSSHELIMLLDDAVVYSAPLSEDLAGTLRTKTVRELSASTGYGEEGLSDAKALEIHLRAGALPVDVELAGSGSVTAALGEHFKNMSLLAALLALVAVGVTIFYRYREPAIVLPMVGTNIAEILILLGIARFIQQLDLASIAGLIAVLGTGIDQLVVITDEVLFEGRVPSPKLYMARLGRALGIIMLAAATTIIAMLPLALMDLSTLRGFAIITILGVLIGVIVTRPAYGRIIMAILSK
jgi:preprotein translocase subunit SecD